MKMDCAFLLVAVPIEKSPRQNIAGSIDIRRPQISEMGAHSIGPKANPRLLKDISKLYPRNGSEI